MRVEYRKSFPKDLERVKDQDLKDRVRGIIERVEGARSLQEVENTRKLRGGDRYYRIRVGDYRIGLILEGNSVLLVRFLHRKDIYRHFP